MKANTISHGGTGGLIELFPIRCPVHFRPFFPALPFPTFSDTRPHAQDCWFWLRSSSLTSLQNRRSCVKISKNIERVESLNIGTTWVREKTAPQNRGSNALRHYTSITISESHQIYAHLLHFLQFPVCDAYEHLFRIQHNRSPKCSICSTPSQFTSSDA